MNADIGDDYATFRAEPIYGRAVTFEVRQRQIDVRRDRGWGGRNLQPRFVVGLKGSDGDGFAHFTTFEKACRAALSRASRYERAYDKPRGIQRAELRGVA